MSWAVGGPDHNGRFIGYGVPAYCDHPGCSREIDRGLGYACGGGVMEDVPNCGQFFCPDHLHYVERDDEDGERQGDVCDACRDDRPPFTPSAEHPDWIAHVSTDESWAEWRALFPERLARLHGEDQ